MNRAQFLIDLIEIKNNDEFFMKKDRLKQKLIFLFRLINNKVIILNYYS